MSESTQAPQGEFRCPACGGEKWGWINYAAGKIECRSYLDCKWHGTWSDVLAARQGEAKVGGDWPEDFEHENGRYQCKCSACGETFIGHKRRVVCKACAEAKHPSKLYALATGVRGDMLIPVLYTTESAAINQCTERSGSIQYNVLGFYCPEFDEAKQQLAEAREQLESLKTHLAKIWGSCCPDCGPEQYEHFAQLIASNENRLREELAAVTSDRDRLAAEGVALLKAGRTMMMCSLPPHDISGTAMYKKAEAVFLNSPATSAEAGRVRRLEAFVERCRKAVVSPFSSGVFRTCFKELNEALAALDAKGGAT